MPRPRRVPNKKDVLDEQNLVMKIVEFTGVARTVVCHMQQGHNNFKIVTLHIEDGIVIKKEVSDPYASFEAISRLEVQCHEATLNLNSGYENGIAWRK